MKNSSLLLLTLLSFSSSFCKTEDAQKSIIDKCRSQETIEQIAVEVKDGRFDKLDEILTQIKDSMTQEELDAAKAQLIVDGKVSQDRLKEILKTSELFNDEHLEMVDNLLDRVLEVFGWSQDVSNDTRDASESSESAEAEESSDQNQEEENSQEK